MVLPPPQIVVLPVMLELMEEFTVTTTEAVAVPQGEVAVKI